MKLASPCLASFALFEKEQYEMFGDKDRILNAVSKAMAENTQGNEESVRKYASRIRTNWNEVGWGEELDKRMLDDTEWWGLKPAIKSKIWPFYRQVRHHPRSL